MTKTGPLRATVVVRYPDGMESPLGYVERSRHGGWYAVSTAGGDLYDWPRGTQGFLGWARSPWIAARMVKKRWSCCLKGGTVRLRFDRVRAFTVVVALAGILILAGGCSTADPLDYEYLGIHHDQWVEIAATCRTDMECETAARALRMDVPEPLGP